jgi:hypothetical protein
MAKKRGRAASGHTGDQKGPQDHAEGDHGRKTRKRIIQQLRSGPHEQNAERERELVHDNAAWEGKRRLVEDRQQHDEGEKNSERTRLFQAMEREDDHGPSDNRENLHGITGSREHRADFRQRDSDGLPSDGKV